MKKSAQMRALTVGVALSVGSSAAWSEEPAKADDMQLLQEIVVTAQFREQGLQSTPVAITAVTGSQLEQRTASSVTDLNGLAPNPLFLGGCLARMFGPQRPQPVP